MLTLLNLDPKILSALIAAITSITIAGISGIYVVVSTRRKLENLKKETVTTALAQASVESFKADSLQYREAYNAFFQDALSVSDNINELFSKFHRFYQGTARLFALRHSDFISTSIVDKIVPTDEALSKIFEAKREGQIVAPEDLADAAYKGMKAIIEGLAEQ